MTFFYELTMKKNCKKLAYACPMLLLVAILAQWWRPVASTKALDLLHQAMRMVWYRRIAMAIKMASKVGQFFCHRFVCCCPGHRWGNTEQVVA
jgi:hypothetical protein